MTRRGNPSPVEARRFAVLWMCAAAFAGGLLYWRHHPLAGRVLWTASVTVGVLGALVPPFANRFYRRWMSLAEGMNTLVARFLMVFIFYIVVTPMAFLFKLLGRDALNLKKSGTLGGSYWREHDHVLDPSYYKHLY